MAKDDLTKAQRRLHDYIMSHAGVRGKVLPEEEITSALGISHGTIFSARRCLKAAGYIDYERRGRGVYYRGCVLMFDSAKEVNLAMDTSHYVVEGDFVTLDDWELQVTSDMPGAVVYINGSKAAVEFAGVVREYQVSAVNDGEVSMLHTRSYLDFDNTP